MMARSTVGEMAAQPTRGETYMEEETIKLEQFLKLAQVVATGGQAKMLIQSGAVRVNGVVETRRGRKLRPGDSVVVDGEELIVASE